MLKLKSVSVHSKVKAPRMQSKPSLSVLVPQSPETLLRKTRNKKESNDVSCYLSGRHSSYWSGLRVVYTCTDCAGRWRYNTTGHYHTDADQDVRRHSLG